MKNKRNISEKGIMDVTLCIKKQDGITIIVLIIMIIILLILAGIGISAISRR